MTVHPSVRRIKKKKLGYHWTDFREICYPMILQNTVEKIRISLKSDKNSVYFYVKTYLHLRYYLAEFLE